LNDLEKEADKQEEKLLKILFNDMRAQNQEETNLVLLLSNCPSGLSEFQLENITGMRPKFYGNWKKFLD